MKFLILSLILSSGCLAKADVRNELGRCFFNTTNQLMKDMNANDKKALSNWQNSTMTKRNLNCNQHENQSLREVCHVEGLVKSIKALQGKSTIAANLIKESSKSNNACSYLKLFGSKHKKSHL